MKYFIDAEFLEGKQKEKFPFNLIRKETKPTIDLISIGIVAEGIGHFAAAEKPQEKHQYKYDKEYYAISKEFNLKEAWNRFEIKKEWHSIDESTQSTRDVKVYSIRDNILKPIFYEWKGKDINFHEIEFTYKEFKQLLNKYGKSNKQIEEEIKEFCKPQNEVQDTTFYTYDTKVEKSNWIFFKMINILKNLPMYCINLNKELETLNETLGYNSDQKGNSYKLQEHLNFPKLTNEHNALANAKWNKQLYHFLSDVLW